MSLQDLQNRQTFTIVVNPYSRNQLCANIIASLDDPARYSYRVVGKTSDVDFTYETDVFSQELTISVVGLYANYVNTVEVTFILNDGDFIMLPFSIDTTGQDYGDTLLSIDYEVFDQDMFDQTIAAGWFVTSGYNGYDKNGDIRMTGMYYGVTSNLKEHDNSIYLGASGFDTYTFGQELYKIGLMGNTKLQYQIPENYGVHHDITWDTSGHMYALGSLVGTPTAENKIRAEIFRFDDSTGELLWRRDYSREFDGQYVLQNTTLHDPHFNSIEFVENLNMLIIDVRSCSNIFFIDPSNGDILYSFDNPASPAIFEHGQMLTALNSESFKYPNGQHTAFLTTNEAYAAYNTSNRIAMTVFNNNSLKNFDGTDNERPIDDPMNEFEENNLDAEGYVYGVDFENNTIELLNSIVFTGHVCEFMSSIYETGNYYCASLAIKGARTTEFGTPAMVIYDTDNNIGVQCLNIASAAVYRSRVFTIEQIQSFI